MGSLTADISKRCHRVLRQLALHTKAPLLYVRPDGFRRNGGYVQRERSRCPAIQAHAANALVTCRMVLRHVQHLRCAAFKRARVGLVANPVVEKHSVAGAERSLAVALRIPGEADARRRIKYLVGHAAIRNSIYAAALQAIGDSRVQIAQIDRDRRTRARIGAWRWIAT